MNKLRDYRLRMGYTQTELAKALNVSQGAVSGYETDKYEPDMETMRRMSELFGASMDELFGIKETEEQPNNEYVARTPETRILASGMDKMPKAERERALSMMRLVFSEYADFFKEG